MYATIEFKGKQYKAEKDVVLTVDKLDAEKGSKIDIDTVLLVSTCIINDFQRFVIQLYVTINMALK